MTSTNISDISCVFVITESFGELFCSKCCRELAFEGQLHGHILEINDDNFVAPNH